MKKPFFIAFKNEDFLGLKQKACKYFAKLFLVLFRCKTANAVYCFSVISISQSRSLRFLWPVRINLFFLMIYNFLFVKSATHPSSHNYPIKRRDELVKSFTMCAFFPVMVMLVMGREPFVVDDEMWPFGNMTLGPVVVI